jgi:hypothetical protein
LHQICQDHFSHAVLRALRKSNSALSACAVPPPPKADLGSVVARVWSWTSRSTRLAIRSAYCHDDLADGMPLLDGRESVGRGAQRIGLLNVGFHFARCHEADDFGEWLIGAGLVATRIVLLAHWTSDVIGKSHDRNIALAPLPGGNATKSPAISPAPELVFDLPTRRATPCCLHRRRSKARPTYRSPARRDVRGLHCCCRGSPSPRLALPRSAYRC